MRIIARLVAAVAVLVGCNAAAPASETAIGLSAVDITPDYPVRLSGFGFRRDESDGVTQRIWAKAIAFGEENPAVIVTVDSTGVPEYMRRDVAERLAKKAKLDPRRFAITSSHTHTAPMVSGVLRTLFGRPVPPEHQAHIDRYTKELADNIEKAALAAIADRKPARLEFGIGVGDLAMNRRTKGGPVDHDLPVLAIRAPDGTLRGVYVSYACHCVTLSNNKVSGDWAGFLQEQLQKDNPGAIALTSIGCGADANPKSGVTGDKVDVATEQGRKLAAEVQRMLKAGALSPVSGAVDAKGAEVELMFDTAPTREQLQKTADANQDYVSYHAKAQLERLDRGEALQTKLPYLIQTWTFGDDLAMVFLPGEVVVDYSLRLKREFDRSRLWVNAYSNDVPCYIPSERILKEGGYEGGGAMTFYDRPSRLASGVEQKIIDEVHRQLPKQFVAPQGTEGIAPKSPEASLRTIRTKPGLEVELVAAEPLVTSPVAIDWGADGKLWVCEMFDYPTGIDQNWQPGGRVKYLEDADGDGGYDRANVFLENLPFPTGVTAWGRGVLVCAAPDILYAEDTDGDGKADKVEKWYTGFATENYQARVNSLSLGLDNWMYGANGLLGGVITRPGSLPKRDIRNHDFRFRLVRPRLETVTGLTQQGRARDDWGRWFGCDNGSGMLYYPHEQRYLARNPHVPAPPPVVRPPGVGYDNVGRVYPISRQLERFNDPGATNQFTAGCGLGVYRDTLLGEEFYGNVFTCEPVNNLVHRMIPVENDAGMIVGRKRAADESASEFLASSDNWFRPVQARSGPDGALYVVDMYRFLIEHPRWIPAERLAEIDARAGADKGRIYRVKPAGKPLRAIRDLTNLSPSELAGAMDHPNGIERDRVHTELVPQENVGRARETLFRIARDSKLPQARIQALAVLHAFQGFGVEELLTATADVDARVRQHAVRMSEGFMKGGDDDRLRDRLVALVDDPSPIVRHELAYLLGEWRDPRAGGALARLARDGLADNEMRIAVLSSVDGQHCEDVLKSVAGMPEDAPGRAAWLPPLVATAAGLGDPTMLTLALAAVLPGDSAEPTASHFESLAGVFDALERRNAKLPEEVELKMARTLAAARQAASDANNKPATRASALKVLGRGDAPTDELDLLCRLAADGDESVRGGAHAALRRQTAAGIPDRLLKTWRQTSPAARPALINLLLGRDDWTLALLDAVKRNVVGRSEVSLADRQRLTAEGVRDDIRKLAGEVFPAKTTDPDRQAVIDRYAAVGKMIGDAARGGLVFDEQCAACHLLSGVGYAVGPDLSILRDRNADYFVKNILDPSAIIEPRFTNYQVVLKDRRVLSGLITSETAAGFTLHAGSGASENVAQADVEDIRAAKISMMPEGLEAAISPEQMADLVAFIKSASTPRAAGGGRDNLPRDPASLAKTILDPKLTNEAREAAINANPQFAAELIAEMTSDLKPGDERTEYDRIPWIWRVAIACGKRDDAGEVKSVLDVSLPKDDQPLRDWQAVVIGGGIINGISQRGAWPAARVADIIGDGKPLETRWQRSLDLADAMSDDEKVRSGTRYDALRMLGCEPWEKRGEHLVRYLAKGTHAELQMGAVSALADVDSPKAAEALTKALPDLTPENRKLAEEGRKKRNTSSAAPKSLQERLAEPVLEPGTPLSEVQAFCESRIPSVPEAKDVKAWETRAAQIRKDVLHKIIFRGVPPTWRDSSALKGEWLDTLPGGPGYSIRKLRYEALPALWIPALLYVPEKLAGRVPVVVNFNGHVGAEGKAIGYKQVICINQAKRGMLALNVEWLGMGQLADDSYNHNRLNQLDLCGVSGLAPFYLLMTRALDVLLEHPNADPARVAVTGLSGGGWQTVVLSSLDPRVTLAAPVAGYSSLRTRARHLGDLGDTEQTPSDFATVADYTHLTALLAPRPSLLVYNAKDECCFASAHALAPLIDAAAPAFALHGKRESLRAYVNKVPGTHNYEKDNREAFYRMLGDHFFPRDAQFAREEIACAEEIKSPDELRVPLPAENVTLNSLARAASKDLPRKDDRGGDPRARLREIVRSPVYTSIKATGASVSDAGGASTARWSFKFDGTWTVPAVEFSRAGTKSAATAIVLNDAGRKATEKTVGRLLDDAYRVVAVDLFSFGESAPQTHGYLLSLLVAATGERPLGIEASQLVYIAGWLKGVHGQPVTIVAAGPRSTAVARVAAAIEADAIAGVELTGGLGSFKELIERNRSVDQMPDLFCFGLLESFDVPQLDALIAPRPVTLRD